MNPNFTYSMDRKIVGQIVYQIGTVTVLAIVVGAVASLAAIGFVEAIHFLNEQLLISPYAHVLAEDQHMLVVAGVLVAPAWALGQGEDPQPEALTVATWGGSYEASQRRAYFDLERFPGKRALRKSPVGLFEWALLSLTVPREQLYDLLSTRRGLDLAAQRLDEIRESIIWWTSGKRGFGSGWRWGRLSSSALEQE